MGKGNSNLNGAKNAKYDEFYTQYSDVEAELGYYKPHFEGKVVYCNCDGEVSNFVKYFADNFNELKLHKLIATCYNANGNGKKLVFDGKAFEKADLEADGGFKSAECLELLVEADIVVTNPPFSLFREFIPTLIESKKKFLVLGNMNAVLFNEVFPYIKSNDMWLGVNCGSKVFEVPQNYSGASFTKDGKKYSKLGNVIWYTNLEQEKRNSELPLTKTYNETDYPKYENYDAIEVSKTCNIPTDYNGLMGVPISFLPYFCPKQFTIVDRLNAPILNGKPIYKRVIIKNLERL